MTDLDELVASQLRAQPPVVVPPVTALRRRADRRRQRRVGSCVLAVVGAAVGVGALVPALLDDRRPDVVDSPPSAQLVRPGPTVLGVCYAGRRGCAYTPQGERVDALVKLVNAERPVTTRTGCTAADSDVPDVRVQFAYSDGTHDDVRVVDCLLTRGRQGRGPAVYAPEVARRAASGLTPSADGSRLEGCAAVVEDLAALLARTPPDGPPAAAEVPRLAQVAESTMTQERTYLTGPQRAIVDEVRPSINALLLGGSQTGEQPGDLLRRGLRDLRATCPTG